jgi:GTP-binding protein
MEITSVNFIKSSPDLISCPKPAFPEYAFSGRSNVGKSSLINMLTGIKNLAKTSSTPGKTKHINYFLVNNSWYLVDLPGYGYARVGGKLKKSFPVLIQDYLLKRDTLACLIILIDCRHEPLENDLNFINWAGQKQIPLALCFTKTDKLSVSKLEKNITNYKKTLLEYWEELPEIFFTSSVLKTGRDELMAFIERTNRSFFTAKK